MSLPTLVDSTMLTCLRSCAEKFHTEFVLGHRPSTFSIDLHAGGCFSGALEAVYRGIYVHGLEFIEALSAAHAAFIIAWGDFQIPEYKKTAKTRERMWEAVESYFAQYPPSLDHVQPYINPDGSPALEFTFAIPLDLPGFPLHPSGAPFLYGGRFDLLGVLNGRPCIRDEKTTGSSIGFAWADQWNLRSQFIGYAWACQQMGIETDLVVVRGIAIQKTQIVHAEAQKVYPRYMVDRWLEQVRRDLIRMIKCHDDNYWDMDLGSACSAYGGCAFVDVCMAPDPAPWRQNFPVKHWDPTRRNPEEVPDV